MLDLMLIVTLAFYIALIVLMLLQIRRCSRAESIAWILWALHGMAFIVVRFVQIPHLGIAELNVWSSAIRIHGLITLITIEAMRYARMRVKHGC